MPPKGKILIIDDNPDIGETLSDILKSEGYLCSMAYNRAQAIEILSQGNYHQAIVDVMLPDGDGVQLIGEIKNLRPGIRCFSITAYPRQELQESALGAEARDFLTKPLDIPFLIKLLEEYSGIPVLIVDDDQTFAESLKEFLAARGYRAYIAKDWAETKEVLNSVTPDKAIIDTMLPGKDGPGIMRALKKRFPWIEGTLMTDSLNRKTLMKEAIEGKVPPHLVKPFPLGELLAFLEGPTDS